MPPEVSIAVICGIGIFGTLLIKRAKTKAIKMMIFVPSAIAVMLIFALSLHII